MPVSPADFEFYSRVTGVPIPNDPVARMRMAPQVYAMRRSPMSKLGSFAKGAAKALGTAALLGGAAAIGGAIGGAGGGAVGGAVGGAGGGFAGGFTGSQYGNDYEPEQSSTPEEPIETVKVEVDAAPTPSAREKAEDLVHAYRGSVPTAPRNEPEVEITGNPVSSAVAAGFGSIEEARSSLQAKYGQRLSHQTEVPQADPNLANESFDAQRASVGEPVESLTTGFPAQTAPGVETAVAQAYEFFEGSPGQSPFQARGAMNELSGQSRQVKETVGDLPKGIRGDVARFISNLGAAPSESAVSAAVQAPSSFGGDSFKDQLRRMSERDQIQYKGVREDGPLEKRIAGGVHDTPYSGSENVLGDAPLGGIEASKSMMGEMLQRGNVLPNAGEIMSGMSSAPAPTPVDPLTGDYRAFVSDKGVEIGNLLKQSQEKKSAPAMDPLRESAKRAVIERHGDVKDPAKRAELEDFYYKKGM